ncbi:hypothetical protein U8V72_21450 [Priestia filamentosa]|uniref:hypothetical protein n=1 Tax=Priestia filamentosa TaxID=1402861 RepID=UPI0005892DA1
MTEMNKDDMANNKSIDTLMKKMQENPEMSNVEVINSYISIFESFFKPYLIKVGPSANTVIKEELVIQQPLQDKLFHILSSQDLKIIEAFAQAKYFLDRVFFNMTEMGALEYVYNPDFLLTSEELNRQIGVSHKTLHRYTERGMETVCDNGIKKYPLHNSYYWGNGLWVARLQILNQVFRLRSRTIEDIKSEIKEQIKKFESTYGMPFKQFAQTDYDPNEMENATDFREWQHLTEELKELEG